MSLLFVVLLESIAISWMYGSRKIARQIEEMHGHKPGKLFAFVFKCHLINDSVFGNILIGFVIF